MSEQPTANPINPFWLWAKDAWDRRLPEPEYHGISEVVCELMRRHRLSETQLASQLRMSQRSVSRVISDRKAYLRATGLYRLSGLCTRYGLWKAAEWTKIEADIRKMKSFKRGGWR